MVDQGKQAGLVRVGVHLSRDGAKGEEGVWGVGCGVVTSRSLRLALETPKCRQRQQMSRTL